MVWKKSVLYIYIAVVLDRLTPTLSVITVIYALDNASRSNDVKVTTLNSLQCGRRFVDFNTSAVRFTTGVPQQCESLNLEWTINPTYEPGFLYARKRRNAKDFRANGGIHVGQGETYYTTTFPVLLEPGVSIIFDLIPHFDDSLTLSLKTPDNAFVMHFVCKKLLGILDIRSKSNPNGSFTNAVSIAGCPFVNHVSQTLVLEIETDMGIQISLDGRVLTTYHSVLNPSMARKLNFWFNSAEDFILLNRIEFIKV